MLHRPGLFIDDVTIDCLHWRPLESSVVRNCVAKETSLYSRRATQYEDMRPTWTSEVCHMPRGLLIVVSLMVWWNRLLQRSTPIVLPADRPYLCRFGFCLFANSSRQYCLSPAIEWMSIECRCAWMFTFYHLHLELILPDVLLSPVVIFRWSNRSTVIWRVNTNYNVGLAQCNTLG